MYRHLEAAFLAVVKRVSPFVLFNLQYRYCLPVENDLYEYEGNKIKCAFIFEKRKWQLKTEISIWIFR